MFLVLTLILVNMKDFGHLKTIIIAFLKACHDMFFHDTFLYNLRQINNISFYPYVY